MGRQLAHLLCCCYSIGYQFFLNSHDIVAAVCYAPFYQPKIFCGFPAKRSIERFVLADIMVSADSVWCFYVSFINREHVRELKKFCKSEFDIDSIFSTASELKYVHEFKNQFAEQVENPSDELTRLFLQGCYTGQKTQAVIEKFRPLLKKALNDYISETMNDKIKNALGGSGGSVSVSEKSTVEAASTEKDADTPDSNESKIVTTEEELEAYFIIKNLLKDVVDLQDITYKDTESYINILYKKNTRKWICRLKLTDTVKTLIVPDEEKKGQKFNLTSVYNLEQYNDLLHKILARYM